MLISRAISTLTLYELRRAIARKRIILLIALIFLAEAAIYLILTLLPAAFIQPFKTYAWIIGLTVPSTILLHILALTIGAAAFSEEYEMGTADFWLTRPMTRIEYFTGKVVGSLAFTSAIVATYTALSLLLSWWIFGPQSRLDLLPTAALASVLSALTFLSIGLAAGELLRRGMLATILAATALFTSLIAETYLAFVGAVTDNQSLRAIAEYLPSWAASRLTATVISAGLGIRGLEVPLLAAAQPAETLPLIIINITLYSTAFLAVSLIRLAKTDITRKIL